MRAVIYTRVSTAEQVDNVSLDTQRKECLRYCEREGIEVDRVFVEEGASAKTADRPRPCWSTAALTTRRSTWWSYTT